MEFTKPGIGMTMNVAYVQRIKKEVGPALVASQGLKGIGYHVEHFDMEDIDKLPITPATLVVAFIEPFRNAVEKLLKRKLPVYNYPEQLIAFRHRKVWEDTLGNIRNKPELWPVFIKPADEIKSFAGRVIKDTMDLVSQAGLPNETKVLCSEPIEFLSEYRVFVQQGAVIGCRNYKGDPLVFPDATTICTMIQEWKDAPAAYVLDVGLIKKDGDKLETALVEINAAHSAGDYGLDYMKYARFLETYWCDIMGTTPLP